MSLVDEVLRWELEDLRDKFALAEYDSLSDDYSNKGVLMLKHPSIRGWISRTCRPESTGWVFQARRNCRMSQLCPKQWYARTTKAAT
jgi:hypothetical protein